MQTSEHTKDLEDMKERVKTIKVNSFDYCIQLMNYTQSMLSDSGHKSIEAAIKYALKDAEMSVQTETRKYLKKYPD